MLILSILSSDQLDQWVDLSCITRFETIKKPGPVLRQRLLGCKGILPNPPDLKEHDKDC